MANVIVCVVDPRDQHEWFFFWSTGVDAPVSEAMRSKELEHAFLEKEMAPPFTNGPEEREERYHWEQYLRGKVRRSIDRARRNGVSICDYPKTSGLAYIMHNRAGEREECIPILALLDNLIHERRRSR